MKFKTLIVACIAFSSYGFGYGQAFASGRAPVVAQLTNAGTEIASITLDSDGVLTVAPRKTRNLIVTRISKESLQQLSSLAQSLTYAEIKSTHNTIVCMMAFQPFALWTLSVGSLDKNTSTFVDGPKKDVLTYHNCSIPDQTLPVQSYDLISANELQTALRVLGNEAFAHNL